MHLESNHLRRPGDLTKIIIRQFLPRPNLQLLKNNSTNMIYYCQNYTDSNLTFYLNSTSVTLQTLTREITTNILFEKGLVAFN